MDKRIVKTKKNIKQQLISCLDSIPFDKLTVSELCKQAETSRITFYTYYDDKYSVVDELFHDYLNEAKQEYILLESKNNIDHQQEQSTLNLLECILTIYFRHYDFFRHAGIDKNPVLGTMFFQTIYSSVEHYLIENESKLNLAYAPSKIASILCCCFIGLLSDAHKNHESNEQLKKLLQSIYRDLLTSDLFKTKNQ